MRMAGRHCHQSFHTAPTEISPDVRRRILEAVVRSPQDWQEAAIRTAWHSGDEDWMRTAVVGMRFVPGFEREILEIVGTRRHVLLLGAVRAAGAQELESAWVQISSKICLTSICRF